MDLIKLLSNPVRVQIMQYLQAYSEATTKEISEELKDVPTPTLYRHINAMLKEEILIIKEERKVRGSIERLITINTAKLTEAENGSIADSAFQFLMGLYSKFQRYSCKADADPLKDKVSLRTSVLSLTDEKYDEFMHEFAALIQKYQQCEKEENEKLRSVSYISIPVMEEEK